MFGRVASCIDPITGEPGVEPETLAGPAEGVVSKIGYNENVNYNVVIENGGVGTGYVGLSSCRPITYNPACVIEIDGQEETIGVLTVDCIKGNLEGACCTWWMFTDCADDNKNYNVPLWSGCYGDDLCKFQGLARSNAYPLYFNPNAGRLTTCEFRAGTNTSLTDNRLTSTCFTLDVDSFTMCTDNTCVVLPSFNLRTAPNTLCFSLPGIYYNNCGCYDLHGSGFGPAINQFFCAANGRLYDGYGEAWVESCRLGSQLSQTAYTYTYAGLMCYVNGGVTSVICTYVDNNSCGMVKLDAYRVCTNATNVNLVLPSTRVSGACAIAEINYEGLTSCLTNCTTCYKFCFEDFNRYVYANGDWQLKEGKEAITPYGSCNNFTCIICCTEAGTVALGCTNAGITFYWYSSRCLASCYNMFCPNSAWTLMKDCDGNYDFTVHGKLYNCGNKVFTYKCSKRGSCIYCSLNPEPGTVLGTWYSNSLCLDIGEIM